MPERDDVKLEQILQKILNKLDNLEAGQESMKTEIRDMRAEQQIMKSEISDMRAEQQLIKRAVMETNDIVKRLETTQEQQHRVIEV